MERVLVTGASGSGKTEFTRRLARASLLPVVELDALCYRPGWLEVPDDEFAAAVEAALPDGAWIADGTYFHKLGTALLERADTWIWLDLPLSTVISRLIRRTRGRIRNGGALWGNNRESWPNALLGRDALFFWAIRGHFLNRRFFPCLAGAFPEVELVRLRSPREVEQWLQNVTAISRQAV